MDHYEFQSQIDKQIWNDITLMQFYTWRLFFDVTF